MALSSIKTGNKIIAEYIGWKVVTGTMYYEVYKPGGKSPTSIEAIRGWPTEESAWNSISNKCNFHLHWNLLMPVVQKIIISEIDGFYVEDVIESLPTADIYEIYEAVRTFVLENFNYTKHDY